MSVVVLLLVDEYEWQSEKVYVRTRRASWRSELEPRINATEHNDILFRGQHTKRRSLPSYLPRMPKTPAPLPLSGLFGIVKPSGPTSMHVVDQLKKLVCNSRLFVDEDKLAKTTVKKRSRRDNVKVGQGGTLDPLAEGVLGECIISIRSGSRGVCASVSSANSLQWSALGRAPRN
jgi:hypothetical protein